MKLGLYYLPKTHQCIRYQEKRKLHTCMYSYFKSIDQSIVDLYSA